MVDNYFSGINRGHPIFSRHRGHAVRLDAVVSFPPGCGGNFLTLRGTNDRPADAAANFYIGCGSHHLFMDDIPWWDQPVDLDALHASLELDPGLPPPDRTIGRCHHLPWMTMSVFDTSIGELVSLTIGLDDAWFCDALNRIKWVCNTGYNDHPHMLFRLLEDAHHDGPVDLISYRLLCETVLDRFGVDCADTVLVWKHYMACKAKGRRLDDMGFFSETAERMVFMTLLEHLHGAFKPYLYNWRGDVYDAQLAEIAPMVGGVTEVDYMELMLDGMHMGTGYLSTVDRGRVIGYMRDNINLVDRWVGCCRGYARDPARGMLDAMRRRLESTAS